MFKNKGLNHIEHFSWVFIQSLWVGGIWLTILIIFPMLNRSVLAPILVYNVIAELVPKVMLMVICCIFLQLCLFIKAVGIKLLFKNYIGYVLMISFALSIVFLGLYSIKALGHYLQMFLYMIIGLLGIFLMFYLPPWLQQQRKRYVKKLL